MVADSDPARKKRVVVILKGVDYTQKSGADIVRRVSALCSVYEVTVVTTTYRECRSFFPNARVFRVPWLPVRFADILVFSSSWALLPFIRADLVYVADMISSPSIVTTVHAPVLSYGNSHPMQHVLTARNRGGMSSRIAAQFYCAFFKIALMRCNMILAISPQLAKVYESFGVPSNRVRVLGVGVPLENFRRRIVKQEPPGKRIWVGVYHGTVAVERGLDVMIQGAKILGEKRRDFKIQLVGCSREETELVTRLTSSAGVEDLFETVAKVPYTEIPKFLWNADWGISLLEPNLYFVASPPIKVLEFLAAGLPVIANQLSTHSLYLEDHVNSLLVPYAPESFAEAMQMMIEDSQLRSYLATNALKSSSQYSESSSIGRLMCTAKSLMEGTNVDECFGGP